MTRLRVRLAAALAVLCVLPACSQVTDTADSVTSAARSLQDPWTAGCVAVDAGLRINHLDRSAQLRILDGLSSAPGLGDDFRSWLELARKALSYTDPLSLGRTTQAKLNGPCVRHGHPISSLDKGSSGPSRTSKDS